MNLVVRFCALIGFVEYFKSVLLLPYYFYIFYIREFLFGSILQKVTGKWAVVTGCTDGIGLHYAFQLAANGLNIVLIGRNENKLNDVVGKITSKYSVETKVIVVDFTHDLKIYELISSELTGLDVAILINNVGISYPRLLRLDEIPDATSFTTDILRCNVESVTRMCQMLLPHFMKKRCGYIVNISSYAAVSDSPFLALYTASKGYILSFSRALSDEYREFGITVQCVAPLFVSTNLSRCKPSFFIPKPDSFAKSALNTLGHLQFTFGCFQHHIQHALFSFLPRFVILKALRKQREYQAAVFERKREKLTEKQ